MHGTLLHILDTEWGWRGLFQSIDSASELLEADFPNIAAFAAHWHEEEAAMRAYLAGLNDEDMESHLYTPLILESNAAASCGIACYMLSIMAHNIAVTPLSALNFAEKRAG